MTSTYSAPVTVLGAGSYGTALAIAFLVMVTKPIYGASA